MAAEVNQRYQAVDTGNNTKAGEYLSSMTKREVIQEVVAPVLLRSSLGSATGALIGSSGGPAGAAGGALIGSSLGTFSGTARSVFTRYRAYKLWLKENQEKEVIRELRKFHEEHEGFRDFCDPVTLDLLEDPVRSPYGHVYNRRTINDLVGDDGLVADPFRNPSFQLNELVDAPEVLDDMRKVDVSILKDELKNQEISEGVRKGLQVLIEGLEGAIQEQKSFRKDQLAVQAASSESQQTFWQVLKFWK